MFTFKIIPFDENTLTEITSNLMTVFHRDFCIPQKDISFSSGIKIYIKITGHNFTTFKQLNMYFLPSEWKCGNFGNWICIPSQRVKFWQRSMGFYCDKFLPFWFPSGCLIVVKGLRDTAHIRLSKLYSMQLILIYGLCATLFTENFYSLIHFLNWVDIFLKKCTVWHLTFCQKFWA